jgi:hypothetical protein
MKRRILLASLSLLVVTFSAASAEEWPYAEWSHRFEITPFIGYQWTGARSTDVRQATEVSGTVHFDSGIAWGAIVDVNLAPGVQFEALYQRYETRLTFEETRSDEREEMFDLAMDYIQGGVLGGTQYGKVFPFAKVTLGANHLSPQGVERSDAWLFGATLGIGAKLYAHDRFSARLELQLPWTYLSGSSGYFCDPAGNCYSPVGGTGLVQMNIMLGVTLLLGG